MNVDHVVGAIAMLAMVILSHVLAAILGDDDREQ